MSLLLDPISPLVLIISHFYELSSRYTSQGCQTNIEILKGTLLHGMILRHPSHLSLVGFSDVGWGSDWVIGEA